MVTNSELEALASKLLNDTPPAQWEAEINQLSESERMELGRKLDGLASSAALLAAYVNARSGGCGSDPGHKHAVKKMNRIHKIVRKALGYHTTYDMNI